MKDNHKEPALLECRNVSRVFGVNGETTGILAGVDLRAELGRVTVISGKSGAGKSVLLWLLAGLDTPTAGEIYFEERPLSTTREHELTRLRRDRISIIFQDFNLIASQTALENVMAPMAGRSVPRRERRQKAGAALVVATHGLWPLTAADTVYRLAEGKVVELKTSGQPVG